MITEKQANARRNNGKLSQGPRTPMGKANSSQNSLKHGFRARTPLIPGESEAELARFSGGIWESIAPSGAIESLLADCLTGAAWQMRRFPVIASEILASELNELTDQTQRRAAAGIEGVDETSATALGRAFIRSTMDCPAFWALSRYQTTTERTLFRCLHEIQRLQAARAGNVNVILPNEPTEVLESKE